MSIASEAFRGLYPDSTETFEFSVRYSSRFNDYNANVRYGPGFMHFHLSKKWRGVSREIVTGLLQSLMLKAFNDEHSTVNIDLYNIFLKKACQSGDKKSSHPELEASFHRLNGRYFNSLLEQPNLTFGRQSRRKLGSYEYGSDTIVISSLLEGHQDLIDYVMYHEMLHKKFKFRVRGRRSYHHTPEFRAAEQRFEGRRDAEKKLQHVLGRKPVLKWLGV